VPVEVTTDRQFALAMRWLGGFCPTPAKGMPMKEALGGGNSRGLSGFRETQSGKRDEVHKMAQANKAFAHFRW